MHELIEILEQQKRQLEGELRARIEYETGLKTLVKERDDFISILGHELRTPLTSATLQTQVVKKFLEEVNIPDDLMRKLIRSLDVCSFENNRMKRLIDNVLDNTRIRAGTFTLDRSHFDLGSLVREVVTRFQDYKFSTYGAISVSSISSVFGFWDRTRIEQILINLISNSLKFGEGKPIEVAVKSKNTQSIGILKVKDYGIGIPKNKQESVFNKFERGSTVHSNSGLGLGLYIVKQIVDAHHGKLSLESSPGLGTEVIVELPTT